MPHRKGAILYAALFLTAASPAAAQTLRAADVAAGVGVNVHVEYTDSSYADVARTLDALKLLGVSLVRDNAPDPHNQGQGSYGVLARHGIRFDLFANGGDIATAVSGMAALEAAYPGAVHAIEGPNEVNNHATFSYAGITDKNQAATAYQAALYAAVKTAAILKAIPVAAFTDYPATAGACDLANFHSYPDSRGAPEARLARDQDEARSVSPGKPIVDTEFGYYTQPVKGGIGARAQARLILEGLLDNAARGVRETYLYQLFDAYPDPGDRDSEKHYGLFDLAYRPKVSAEMLGRLMRLLQDNGANPHRFPLRVEGLTIEGLPETARTLVIEKAGGATLLAVWNEVPVWDGAREADLEGRKVEFVLKTNGSYRSARSMDLVDGGEHHLVPSPDMHLTVGTSPLIVELLR